MILAVEIENSKINFGIFDTDGSNTTTFGITADIMKTSDEYAVLIDGILNYYKIDRNEINGIALCSVVPMLTNIIYLVIKQIFPTADLIKVEKGIKTGFAIKVDNPSELGADLVANATAVMEIKANENIIKGSSVIIDVGTATTIFALNEKNEFIAKLDSDTLETSSLVVDNLSSKNINSLSIDSLTNYLIHVDLQNQKTYIYSGSKNSWALAKTFSCSTGVSGSDTPEGIFTIKERGDWFFSDKYQQGAKYWVQFSGNYLFHSFPYDESQSNILDYTLGTPSSHGCIRLSVEDSKWIYDNIPSNTKVIIK